ncbi:hypothetical protein TBLA_0H01080 [Henningerozyma blattae CBS 6284]|uniref:Hsp90 chaperone protein kinase-targeting subunit n=1 Tax=Henningerozyma blattae (strain ATCC 34711 / CBS 6284 / DSM 70876 / NBRC 10599 / NRRL Y-10934 / UCD 77-7) TaxID=1071380 RepID=I2H7P4_HENB6|nr:hypothetical protein TBLA_0H01080 [Tetrapisispora blattae CBS 6284]CCH62396.1 hypothetical protein TBLA_0H01080 [Tetrapisispora blattae CBS 6284]
MAIDYSKWDKIELSDDSDIEVHPNVDKRSFIKWKQQSIHEERFKRNNDIKTLEAQVTMYAHLNKRVDKLLLELKDEDLISTVTVSKYLNANFDKNEKSTGDNVDPDIPTFNEMVEDLFEQLANDAKKENKDPKDGKLIREMISKHRAKIDHVTKEAKEKLNKLYIEKNSHISSDDVHTGFNSSFLNKKDKNSETSSNNVKAMESLKEASSTSNTISLPKPKLEFIEYKDDVMKLAPETEKFGEITVGNYKQCENYLIDNMQILSEQQKDALMMKSFEYELNGNSTLAYQIIHQSELMSYIREIYDIQKIPYLDVNKLKEIIGMFFNRVLLNTENPKGKQQFLESVQTKFEHVKNRCKIMEQEEQEENGEIQGVETIQLKALDDSTELEVNLPNFNSKDPEDIRKVEIFNKLPKDMQDAVKTSNLDKVNEVFATMSVEKAEAILELFNEADLIGIKALLDDPNDFEKLQEEYNANQVQFEDLTLEEQQEVLKQAELQKSQSTEPSNTLSNNNETSTNVENSITENIDIPTSDIVD